LLGRSLYNDDVTQSPQRACYLDVGVNVGLVSVFIFLCPPSFVCPRRHSVIIPSIHLQPWKLQQHASRL